MALPDLIEILPLDRPLQANIMIPGSKSITNRALILGALAEGETVLEGALWSEDTQVMVECLQELGFIVNVERDPAESSNRRITVYGKGGQVPRGGTTSSPVELFVGNAGTAARFLAAFVCLGSGVYRLHGVPRMHDRPQAELFSALRELGFEIIPESGNEKLPARISVTPVQTDPGSSGSIRPPIRSCSVSIENSSQFASALLLCARVGGWDVKVLGQNQDESPYVKMTAEMVEAFPRTGGVFKIEADASSASYLEAAHLLAPVEVSMVHSEPFGSSVPTTRFSRIGIANPITSNWQVDRNFRQVLAQATGSDSAPLLSLAGAKNVAQSPSNRISRSTDLGDSIMTAIVLAPFSPAAVRFTDLGRLRLQECERVIALKTELTKCGGRVDEIGDTLVVYPSALHGAEIETYNDHRMAMCFAILGLKVPGIKIKNPACVKKTFPNFFQKLAAAPPRGLGAAIRDARTGAALAEASLCAE
jgi:3-phosphoshikimate 1-carboxyvinyltransferase